MCQPRPCPRLRRRDAHGVRPSVTVRAVGEDRRSAVATPRRPAPVGCPRPRRAGLEAAVKHEVGSARVLSRLLGTKKQIF